MQQTDQSAISYSHYKAGQTVIKMVDLPGCLREGFSAEETKVSADRPTICVFKCAPAYVFIYYHFDNVPFKLEPNSNFTLPRLHYFVIRVL